mmetsp:Transcript_78980/g.164052  ORF Transcript_78980/g.164052 Transcript_78980/m.164052 type:complete len:219 (+) Transcript_78980:689-1345(+)
MASSSFVTGSSSLARSETTCATARSFIGAGSGTGSAPLADLFPLNRSLISVITKSAQRASNFCRQNFWARSQMVSTLSGVKLQASQLLSWSQSSPISHRLASSRSGKTTLGAARSSMVLRPYIQDTMAVNRSGSTSGKLTIPVFCSPMPAENIFKKNGDLAERTSLWAGSRDPSLATRWTSGASCSAASVSCDQADFVSGSSSEQVPLSVPCPPVLLL